MHSGESKSRVTCEVCHAKLRPKIKKEKVKIENKNPFEETSSGAETSLSPAAEPEKKPRKTRQAKVKKEPSEESKDESAPPKRKRHRKTKVVAIEYFALAGENLLPVSVNIQIKPLKKKDINIEGQNLISLWNRNKSLLK